MAKAVDAYANKIKNQWQADGDTWKYYDSNGKVDTGKNLKDAAWDSSAGVWRGASDTKTSASTTKSKGTSSSSKKNTNGATGSWYADGDKWVYEDQYGNKDYNHSWDDSVWDADEGIWKGWGSGEPPRQENPMGDYQDYLEQARREQERAMQARIDGQVDGINALRPDYQKQAESSAQQAYINKMLAQKGLGEQMAAQGLSGTGVTESANIANENTYGNSVNQTINARDNALRGLDNQITQVRAGGDSDIASMNSQYAQQLAQMLMQQEQQKWENQFRQDQLNSSNNQFNQQFDYQKAQDELNRQAALAELKMKEQQRSYNQNVPTNQVTGEAINQNSYDEAKINNALVYIQREFFQKSKEPTTDDIMALLASGNYSDAEIRAITSKLGKYL